MSSNSKEIAKLKKKYSKWPPKNNVFKNKSLILGYLPAAFSVWILRHRLIKSDYKLKRESIKFFHLSNRAYGAREFCKCSRLLRIAIELLGSNVPQNYANMLNNAVSATFENSKCRRSSSDSILAATKQLELMVFDATGWYQLSRGLFSLGHFRAAWVARENSLDQSILDSILNVKDSTAVMRGIQGQLERRNYIEVGKILWQNQHSLSEKLIAHIDATLCLVDLDNTREHCVSNSVNEFSRDLFRSLVSKKSVALVGPGSPQGFYGTEIDGFDTVIRIKFIGRRMLDVDKRHGVRTDISFIGAVGALKLQEFELQADLESFKLILTNLTDIESIGLVPIYGFEDDAVIYRTPTTAGIRTLKEILKFSPSYLKVFGFDFYTTLTPYSKEVTVFYENSAWQFGHSNDFIRNGDYLKFKRAEDFSEHDPVSNFCFAQNLYKAGLFDIEPYGKSILELTPYQYVERLEEMLGDW